MAPTSAPSARRGRRLLAAILAALSMAAATTTLLTPPARAATPAGPASKPSGIFTTPPFNSPSPSPSTTATPTCDFFSTDPACFPSPSPSPTPSVIVVSPVPDSPTPSPTIPSYLQGTEPSPSPRTGDTVSSPVPLGGGFVDELPTPSSAPAAPTGTLTPHQGGLPLPFLAAGALLILGAVGSLIYAVAPRDKNVFAAARRPKPASPVTFTPYGPDAPGTNILSTPKPGSPPRQGP